MSRPVDVLEVMVHATATFKDLNKKARCPEDYVLDIEDSESAIAAVAELIEAADQAHEFLCEKSPATATAYRLRKALARVRGAA